MAWKLLDSCRSYSGTKYYTLNCLGETEAGCCLCVFLTGMFHVCDMDMAHNGSMNAFFPGGNGPCFYLLPALNNCISLDKSLTSLSHSTHIYIVRIVLETCRVTLKIDAVSVKRSL
jgi:hypothetical protein